MAWKRAKPFFWLDPEIAWTTGPEVFVITVSRADADLVEFLSDGFYRFPLRRNSDIQALLLDQGNLLRELMIASGRALKKQPSIFKGRVDTDINAYVLAAALLPDTKMVALAVSWSRPGRTTLIGEAVKAKADDLTRTYREAVAAQREHARREREALDERYKQQEYARYKSAAEEALRRGLAAKEPKLSTEPLIELLPRGQVFAFGRGGTSQAERRALIAINECGLTHARDGDYQGFLPGLAQTEAEGLVVWEPHAGPAPYPEIRAALAKRLPSAFARPRIARIGRPAFSSGIVSPTVSALDPEALAEALVDLGLDEADVDERRDRIRQGLSAEGFEAIAWYQSHHEWTNETWGIYFDAEQLDDLWMAMHHDLRGDRGWAPPQAGAFLAFGMVLAHELFHARVDAAATWLELTSLRPRYRTYHEKVYQPLSLTENWLEEALANWVARKWVDNSDVQDQLIRRMHLDPDRIARVAEAWLDLSPPGYRDWKKGYDLKHWRILNTQLAQAKPASNPSGVGLPLEGVLRGPLPYEFSDHDVPIRFVGHGVIADRLLSRPANFNVPSRAEIVSALRYFKHRHDSKGGRGSHEKWTGPDERAFILPKRDPVSGRVFRTFLDHLGIDKATYVHEVRPKL